MNPRDYLLIADNHCGVITKPPIVYGKTIVENYTIHIVNVTSMTCIVCIEHIISYIVLVVQLCSVSRNVYNNYKRNFNQS